MNIEDFPVQHFISLNDISHIYGISIIILLCLLGLGIHVWNKYSRVKMPRFVYMREKHLNKVIPALRKVVLSPREIVYVDFSEVEDMTQGAYMVFLAQVEKAFIQNKSIQFYHKPPHSKTVLSIIIGQKEYKHKNIQLTGEAKPKNAETFQTVDTEFIDEVVAELKKLGFTEYYKPFYDYLVELIGNATEHGIQHKNINWWMLRYRDNAKKSMRYVFVDMGRGIIKSYRESGLLRKYMFKSKKQIPIDALNGKLGSSTKMANRGRGLPQIKEIIEKGYVSDFILITNNVSLRYIDNKFVVSKNPNFVGTYFSWTISKENFLIWKDTR